MSDPTPIEPTVEPGADAPIDAAAPAVEIAPSLPELLRVLVDLAMPDSHPDAPGVWPEGAIIASADLDPDHIPLLLERGIVDVAPAPTFIPDAPPAP